MDGDKKPKVKPANENPWYCLATLHGERDEGFDPALAAMNRIAWNRWMAGGLDDERRRTLLAKGWAEAELTPLPDDEAREIRRLFTSRLGNGAETAPPLADEPIDFSDVHFERKVSFEGFLFVKGANFRFAEFSAFADFLSATFSAFADFRSATFSADADFSSATFSADAYFRSATFSADAYFRSATFSGAANFGSATFSGVANFGSATFSDFADFCSATFSDFADFRSATFSGVAYFSSGAFSGVAEFRSATFSADANFSSATFSAYAYFRSATFSAYAYFSSATFSADAYFSSATFSADADFRSAVFSGVADFIGAKLNGWTSFVGVKFLEAAPDFRGATLHEATEWDDAEWPAAPSDREAARRQVYAYQRLKQEMEKLKKHEDELLFFRKELRAKRGTFPTLSPAWCLNALYDLSSSYGQSIVKPLAWLLAIFGLGALLFAWLKPADCFTRYDAMALSFSNIFGLLGVKRDFFDAPTIARFSRPVLYLSATQSILGAILLFLFGLALRNRFRIK